ncbi:UNVERIFIED_CONTAM: protein NDR1 [Sesamum calycinum]|uniref:Protein NDR1 n=1 Tax=Sesamum calycinum TaxID=2727403 RepID=A0AAW2IRJ3_9LAMI
MKHNFDEGSIFSNITTCPNATLLTYLFRSSTHIPISPAPPRATPFNFFDLELENVMPFNGLHYDNVNPTLSYNCSGDRSTLFIPIAQHMVPGFYQGMRKTAHKMTMTHGVPWGDAFAAVSNGSTAVFRVDLATNVKSKQYFWHARKQRLTMGGVMNFSAENGLLVLQFIAMADEKYDEFRLSPASLKNISSLVDVCLRLAEHLLWQLHPDLGSDVGRKTSSKPEIVFSQTGDVAAFGNKPYNAMPGDC